MEDRQVEVREENKIMEEESKRPLFLSIVVVLIASLTTAGFISLILEY